MNLMCFSALLKLFLRFSVASAMLSAVADRFGLYPAKVCVWGNMDNFLAYTAQLLPWLPQPMVDISGWIATILEILFATLLVLGFKLKYVSLATGLLLLTFSLSMLTTVGFKPVMDYSALNATAAAFAIAFMGKGYCEIDNLCKNNRR